MTYFIKSAGPIHDIAAVRGYILRTAVVAAPGLQPDRTGPATTKDQAGDMVSSTVKTANGSDTDAADNLPPLKPGRQVGWVFKNGEVVAIERSECEARRRGDAS